MKKKNWKDNGITLIALVVTIIILLILAGITIGMVAGENGLIQRAKDAKAAYEKAAGDEQVQLSGLDKFLSSFFGSSSIESGSEGEKGSQGTGSQSGTGSQEGTGSQGGTDSTGVQITTASGTKATITEQNAPEYYGTAVKYNWDETTGKSKDGGTYRIFYYDGANPKYGKANTVYLKRDAEVNSSSNQLNQNKIQGYVGQPSKAGTYEGSTEAREIMEKLNPEWAKSERKDVEYANLALNEKASIWYCDQSNELFNNFRDSSIAEYVTGGPSYEMYVDSYNTLTHDFVNLNSEVKGKDLGYSFSLVEPMKYSNQKLCAAYGFLFEGEPSKASNANGEILTGSNTIDYQSRNALYTGGSHNSQGGWFMVSPGKYFDECLCVVDYNNATLSQTYFYSANLTYAPLICVKDGVSLEAI